VRPAPRPQGVSHIPDIRGSDDIHAGRDQHILEYLRFALGPSPTPFGDWDANPRTGRGGAQGLSTGIITAIVGGTVAFLVVLAIAAWLVLRKKRTPKATAGPTRSSQESLRGRHDSEWKEGWEDTYRGLGELSVPNTPHEIPGEELRHEVLGKELRHEMP